jgi:hypothetical protein
MNGIKCPNKNNFEEKVALLMICHGYGGVLYMCEVKSGGGSEMKTGAAGRQERDLYKKIYICGFWNFGTQCPKVPKT